MIKKFRPFWSYDVLKTESWLNQMSQMGYHLKHINFATRTFFFEKGESMNIYYRICYDNKFDGIKRDLTQAGWNLLLANNKFYVITTSRENPPLYPSYLNIFNRNIKIKCVAGIILLFLVCMCIPIMLLITFLLFLLLGEETVETVEVVESVAQPPQLFDIVLGTILFLIQSLIFLWLVYNFFKLRKSNKSLKYNYLDKLKLSYSIHTNGLMSKADEKVMLKLGKVIRKTKSAWFYCAPDKAEQWLEEMKLQGYNLYRTNKFGNRLYFIKGVPRKVKYVVDYQNKTDPVYYELNKECGWKLMFTSSPLFNFQVIAIWAYEYSDNENTPEFYSDKQSKLKHAKSVALTYSTTYFLICFFYIVNTWFGMPSQGMDTFNWTIVLINILLIFWFGRFAIRPIFYYFRVKKV